jgi:hypothetical protein
MTKRRLWAIRCRDCGATAILSRPHRRHLGWFPAEAIQHHPNCDRMTGSPRIRVLHYAERKAALRAEGRA